MTNENLMPAILVLSVLLIVAITFWGMVNSDYNPASEAHQRYLVSKMQVDRFFEDISRMADAETKEAE